MLTPNILKDFSVWLNPTNLKSFNKVEVMKLGLNLVKNKAKPLSFKEQSDLSKDLLNTDSDLAIYCLRIYFYQILKRGAFSLDLRKSRFYFKDNWHFKGISLAHNFDDKIMIPLIKTYSSYYTNESQNIQDDLIEMGLISKNWSQDDKDALVNIFLGHFKTSSKNSQIFEMKSLIDSFGKIFFFIKSKEGVVPSEFALIGVYLTSLYMTLESIKEEIDVESCFKFAQKYASGADNE